jgi:hypothetical protein
MRSQKRRRKRDAGSGSTVPNAPANLVGIDYGDFIQLNWEVRSTNELGFRVYRDGALLATPVLGPGINGVSDNAVIAGNLYTYYVVAYNAAGESARSNTVQVRNGA